MNTKGVYIIYGVYKMCESFSVQKVSVLYDNTKTKGLSHVIPLCVCVC